MKTPEDALVAAFAAISTEDWHGLTMLCDPVSLPVFKRQTVRILSEFAQACEMEREFGEEEFDFDEFLLSEVAGASSLDDVKEMDAGRLFARHRFRRRRCAASCRPSERLPAPRHPRLSMGGRRTILVQVLFIELPIRSEHATAVEILPAHHSDPFDRMLAAQAVVEKLVMVTHDRQLEPDGAPIIWTWLPVDLV